MLAVGASASAAAMSPVATATPTALSASTATASSPPAQPDANQLYVLLQFNNTAIVDMDTAGNIFDLMLSYCQETPVEVIKPINKAASSHFK